MNWRRLKNSLSLSTLTLSLLLFSAFSALAQFGQKKLQLIDQTDQNPTTKVKTQQNLPAQNPDTYIYQPLTATDSTMIHQLDSIRNASEQKKRWFLDKLSQGRVPVGYFDLDFNYLFGYNIYEGYKLGLGAETNHKLSRFLSVGGYFIYGTRDKAIRHGEWINIYPKGDSYFKISTGYRDMKLEFGEPEFLEKRSIFNPEHYRFLLVNNMYRAKRYFFSTEFRLFDPLNIRGFADLSENSAHSHQDQNMPFIGQRNARIGLMLRYSPGTTFPSTPDAQKEVTAVRSDWFLTLIQGLKILDGENHYTKLELKGKINFPKTAWGITSLMLRGGKIFNEAPFTEWFNGYGSYPASFSLSAPWSFSTMRMNEFSAQQFSSLHLRHNFSPLLFSPGKKFSPELILAQNIGIGSHNSSIENWLPDFRRGFFESGIEANKLIRLNLLSLGVGTYYRYGPYRLSSGSENFAWKFSLNFNL